MADEQVVDINAQGFGIKAVESVLSVDDSGDTAFFLAFGYGVDRQGCFTGRFRAVNFDDTPFWKSVAAKK